MRDAEEFAASLDELARAAQALGERMTDRYQVADLIRARDAEVRAETLAGFEVETDDDCFCAVACSPNVIHVRLVGPWEPDTRAPEQRSADTIDDLKRRLGETP